MKVERRLAIRQALFLHVCRVCVSRVSVDDFKCISVAFDCIFKKSLIMKWVEL